MPDRDVDVLIVGAGTGGAYMAWKLAAAGHSCLVLEKEKLSELGRAIGPFHMEEVAFGRLGIPLPEGDELLHTIDRITMWAPGGRHSVGFSFPTMVMDKPLFIQRMHRYARDAGADILERTSVEELVLEGGVPGGVVARAEGVELSVRARLIIDASGIDGAVRTRMPSGKWFENDPVSPEDTIFVYMETWKDVETDLPHGVNSYPYYQGWCAPGPGDTMIVGIGMTGGFDAARRRHREFMNVIPVKGEAVDSTVGRIPYRRPPLSLVDNRLMVVGDAACMNKPFSGEGVVSGFAGCAIAARVAASALASDDLTRDGLWLFNVDYFRGQGAKFAFLTASLPGMMAIGPDEMDLLFEAGFLSEESSLAMQEEYEVKTDPAEALKGLPVLARGLVTGVLKPSSLAGIAGAGMTASRLKAHYNFYPGDTLGFGDWVKKVGPLWHKAERARHAYFADIQ
jgi:digeranylgeranylglycerophospholipid reductase